MLYYAIFLAGVNYAEQIRIIGTTYTTYGSTHVFLDVTGILISFKKSLKNAIVKLHL